MASGIISEGTHPSAATGPGHCLEKGVAISVQGKSRPPKAATVIRTSGPEIWMKLVRPSAHDFQPAEPVRIKYWDWHQGAVAYYWNARVTQVSGLEREYLAIELCGEGITVQRRRSSRLSVSIPFSFTVIDADDKQLTGRKILNARTQNISVGGLAFQTALPLNVGDKLEMNLRLPPAENITALGWVVRCQPEESDQRRFNSVAMQFLQLEAEEQNLLLQFLAESARSPL